MHIPAVRLGLWCLHYAASVAAPLVVGWAGKSEQWGGGSQTQSAALCSTEGGSRAYLTPLSRLEHLARSLCPKGLLVLAHMWKDWLPHLKGSITAEAELEPSLGPKIGWRRARGLSPAFFQPLGALRWRRQCLGAPSPGP